MAAEGLAVQEYESWQTMQQQQIPAKRKAPGSDSEPPGNSKKKKFSGSVQTKNAVQALNEYKPGKIRSRCCVVRNEELRQVWTMLSSVRADPATPHTSS